MKTGTVQAIVDLTKEADDDDMAVTATKQQAEHTETTSRPKRLANTVINDSGNNPVGTTPTRHESPTTQPPCGNLDEMKKQQHQQQQHLHNHDAWTAEEESYAAQLVRAFRKGYLAETVPKGISLQDLLSQTLMCDPRRISRKFQAVTTIGNHTYTPASVSTSSNDATSVKAEIDKTQLQLCRLRKLWLRRVQMMKRRAQASINDELVTKRVLEIRMMKLEMFKKRRELMEQWLQIEQRAAQIHHFEMMRRTMPQRQQSPTNVTTTQSLGVNSMSQGATTLVNQPIDRHQVAAKSIGGTKSNKNRSAKPQTKAKPKPSTAKLPTKRASSQNSTKHQQYRRSKSSSHSTVHQSQERRYQPATSSNATPTRRPLQISTNRQQQHRPKQTPRSLLRKPRVSKKQSSKTKTETVTTTTATTKLVKKTMRQPCPPKVAVQYQQQETYEGTGSPIVRPVKKRPVQVLYSDELHCHRHYYHPTETTTVTAHQPNTAPKQKSSALNETNEQSPQLVVTKHPTFKRSRGQPPRKTPRSQQEGLSAKEDPTNSKQPRITMRNDILPPVLYHEQTMPRCRCGRNFPAASCARNTALPSTNDPTRLNCAALPQNAHQVDLQPPETPRDELRERLEKEAGRNTTGRKKSTKTSSPNKPMNEMEKRELWKKVVAIARRGRRGQKRKAEGDDGKSTKSVLLSAALVESRAEKLPNTVPMASAR